MKVACENEKFPKSLQPSSTSNINEFEAILLMLFKFFREDLDSTRDILLKTFIFWIFDIYIYVPAPGYDSLWYFSLISFTSWFRFEYIPFGNFSGLTCHLYIYIYMKKKIMHNVAEKFVKEAKLELLICKWFNFAKCV